MTNAEAVYRSSRAKRPPIPSSHSSLLPVLVLGKVVPVDLVRIVRDRGETPQNLLRLGRPAGRHSFSIVVCSTGPAPDGGPFWG